MLHAMKAKAGYWGTKFVEGEAVGFDFVEQPGYMLSEDHITDFNKVSHVVVRVKTPNGQVEDRKIQAAYYILATGAHSAELAEKTGIGHGKGMFRHKLPIEPR
jgi:hypothetical protein